MSRELKKEKDPQKASEANNGKPPSEEIDVSVGGEQIKSAADTADKAGEKAKSLDQQLVESQEEVVALKDKFLRQAADFENYKKRIERERAITMKYAGEHIFREMLPVVDNLERAVDQGVVEGADAEKNLAALLEGVELTLKSLKGSLSKFEVTTIDSVGEPFDPEKHEALSMAESTEVAANHVVNEFEKGYFYKDRLLRAAKVIVSSGKAES